MSASPKRTRTTFSSEKDTGQDHMQERAELIAGNNRRGPREALDPHAEEQDKIMERIKAIQDNVQRAHRVDVVDLTVTKEVMHLSDRIPKKWSDEEMKQRAAWRDLHGSIKDFRTAVERQMFGQDGGEGGGDHEVVQKLDGAAYTKILCRAELGRSKVYTRSQKARTHTQEPWEKKKVDTPRYLAPIATVTPALPVRVITY